MLSGLSGDVDTLPMQCGRNWSWRGEESKSVDWR